MIPDTLFDMNGRLILPEASRKIHFREIEECYSETSPEQTSDPCQLGSLGLSFEKILQGRFPKMQIKDFGVYKAFYIGMKPRICIRDKRNKFTVFSRNFNKGKTYTVQLDEDLSALVDRIIRYF